MRSDISNKIECPHVALIYDNYDLERETASARSV
jgi:hypothetical protein